MLISEKIEESMAGYNDTDILTTAEIIEKVFRKYGVNKDSIFPSDYCYNRTNNGIDFESSVHLFEYLRRGKYRYLGRNYKYNGDVIHQKKGVSTKDEHIIGRWTEGIFERY